jgi:hypothetical protein
LRGILSEVSYKIAGLPDGLSYNADSARCAARYDPIMADFNQLAHRVIQANIASTEPGSEEPQEPQTPAQVNGRNGGKKGGPARAAKLTAEQRSEIARKAAQARWAPR